MTTYLVIRPFAPGDEKEIREIVREGTLAPLNSFYFAALTQEVTIQICVILSAVIFIVLGVPFHFCWISFPLVAAVLYFTIYLGHWYKILTTHYDLDNLDTNYRSDPRCGFWVAESWETPSGVSEITFCSEDFVHRLQQKRGIAGCSRKLVGTVAIVIKRDPDKREPPNSVGYLRRLAVRKKYQHKGVGQELCTTAFQHCIDHNYRAVELLITQCHYQARSFFEKQEWKMISNHKKTYLWVVTVGFYVFRKACIRKQTL